MPPSHPLASESGSTPKYVQLAEQLATRIRAGEWADGKVPTVRDIAGEYDVSSFTATRALHLLRDRGLVVTRDRSGSYVAPAAGSSSRLAGAGNWVIVTRVSPGPWRTASESVVRVGFDRLFGEGNYVYRYLDLPPDTPLDDAEKAARSAAQGADGVFFLPSRVSAEACRHDEAFLRGWRRAGVPVVLLDRNLRGERRPLEFDLVASDHFDGGARCTEHLFEIGRRKVACVVASPTSSHEDRLAGYLFAVQARGATPRVIRSPEQADARESYPCVAEELIRLGADGVICYQDYVAVGVILELFRRGKNVPRDVAVVGCDDLPIGRSFALGVTSYTYPSEAIARTAARVMAERLRHPEAPPVRVLLRGELVVRNSTVG